MLLLSFSRYFRRKVDLHHLFLLDFRHFSCLIECCFRSCRFHCFELCGMILAILIKWHLGSFHLTWTHRIRELFTFKPSALRFNVRVLFRIDCVTSRIVLTLVGCLEPLMWRDEIVCCFRRSLTQRVIWDFPSKHLPDVKLARLTSISCRLELYVLILRTSQISDVSLFCLICLSGIISSNLHV